MTVQAHIPESLDFLFDAARYKVAYGGRGAGKSWGFADAALIQASQQPTLTLCCREIQKTIKDSVHSLLEKQIALMGLGGFRVLDNEIRHTNGSSFIFAGLKHNVHNIKGAEGVDRCWVFEAQNVSKSSWQNLIPTIRKPGSEIWVEFNPELETDETYKRFVLTPPADIIGPPLRAIVRKVSYKDNPFFTAENRAEMEADKRRDYDDYLHIWEGHTKQTVEGAIYAKELRAAVSEGRITQVAYDPSVPINTYWDLGYSDMTSIWFAQRVGFELRVVDFYQNRLQTPQHYADELAVRPYKYGTHYLPHDGDAKQLAAAGRSIAAQYRQQGLHVSVLPRLSPNAGIAMTRSLFPMLLFDEARCAEGLQSLRRYKFEVVDGQFSRNPDHDEHSHAADALRYMAMAMGDMRKPPRPKVVPRVGGGMPGEGGTGWMGV